jgi:nodulation protein E
VGVISAIGLNASEFWSSLIAGQSGIRTIELLDTADLRFKNGAEVRGYVPEKYFPEGTDLIDRFAQFAVIAAREAVADAGLQFTPELAAQTAVITGSCIGGQSSQDVGFVSLYLNKTNRVPPFTIPRVMLNAGASHIAMEFGITGPVFTISTACSASNHAVGLAFEMVASGKAELAITGGSEAPFSFGFLKAWEAMRIVAPDTCRPFSRGRKGLILGEAGAMLVLEDWDRAIKRKAASIYAEVVGFGMSADAYHATTGNAKGPAAAMQMALDQAAIAPDHLGHINAHGTGTPANDATEAVAIQQTFGRHARDVWVSSTKSMHGHTVGAAGALEAVATVLAMHNRLLPPTCNFVAPDPECNLRLVLHEPQPASVEYAMSNSFAFGGLNASLLFRRFVS